MFQGHQLDNATMALNDLNSEMNKVIHASMGIASLTQPKTVTLHFRDNGEVNAVARMSFVVVGRKKSNT